MSDAIEVQGLGRAFGEVVALDGLDLVHGKQTLSAPSFRFIPAYRHTALVVDHMAAHVR